MRTSWPLVIAVVAVQCRRSCSRHLPFDPRELSCPLPPPTNAVGIRRVEGEREEVLR